MPHPQTRFGARVRIPVGAQHRLELGGGRGSARAQYNMFALCAYVYTSNRLHDTSGFGKSKSNVSLYFLTLATLQAQEVSLTPISLLVGARWRSAVSRKRARG